MAQKTVTEIPANPLLGDLRKRKRKLRVAAYCRVSTEEEEQQNSFEVQVAYYTDKITHHEGWQLAGIFADDGISGVSTKKREQFNKMIELCRKKKIDLILTKSISRFARNTLDCIKHVRILKSWGIPVIFEKENIDTSNMNSEMILTCLSSFAQAESESTSSRVRWGKRQSMKEGRVTMQYQKLLGYERGPDGKPQIVPEQAEIVRFIYQRYLAGDPLRSIKEQLEAQGCLTAAGKSKWVISNIKSILTNEKYCGDALLQKTFIKDCISKKVIPNTGQLDKVLIQDHHEAIVSHELFDAVQLELARRKAREGGTRRSTPTGLRKYSGKYALSNLLFCGECGTAYRRCTWTQHGEKRPVWRCVSRLSYGKKYCLHSPTLDEEPLQRAILGAINASMDNRTVLESRITAVMEQELLPVAGETMSLADVERALEDLGRQFDSLLKEAASPERQEEYTERFRTVSTSMAELKNRRERLKAIYQENEKASQRLQAISAALEGASADITEWDESTVYQLLEKVTVLSKDRIRVTFRGGLEIEENIKED